NVTSVLLVLFAAGLVSHAVHEFQEVGVLSEQSAAWDTSGVLDENNAVGGIAHALTGYEDNPTPYQLAGWAGYLVIVCVAYLNLDRLHKFI
ncbi:MAG: FTR1 family protein, partial [Candidatus Micrarchaeota archaeon]